MVCTWGESARCGDVRGADNFAKLQKQMAIKFDLQMRPVSMGADKARCVPYALVKPVSLHLSPHLSPSPLQQCANSCNAICQLADGGSIVFCSGALSRRPGKGSTALAAANAALEAAGRGLANDFGPRCSAPPPRNVATTLKVCCPCLLQTARQHHLPRTHSHRNGLKQAFMCSRALC